MGGICMNTYKTQTLSDVFEIDDRRIVIDSALADKFSDVVCPITEKFLRFQIKVFGKNNSDDILSRKIGLSMADELRGYEE